MFASDVAHVPSFNFTGGLAVGYDGCYGGEQVMQEFLYVIEACEGTF